MNNTVYGFDAIADISLLLTEWHGPAIDDLGQIDGRRYISVPAGAALAKHLAKQDPRLRCKRASKEELIPRSPLSRRRRHRRFPQS
jgi:hypothetical protein